MELESERRPVTPAQWAHARELTEGKPGTRSRVAGALGVHISSLHARAAAENWKTVDYRRQDVLGLYHDAVELSASYGGGGAQAARDDMSGADAFGPGEGSGDVSRGRMGTDADATAVETPDDPAELLAKATGFVSRQVVRLMAEAERRGGRLDKTKIDGLAALSRIMERWEVLAKERADEDRKKSDDELAEILKEIDDRIVSLAEEEAERLFEERIAQDAG